MQDIQFAELDARRVESAVVAGFEAAARLSGQTDFTLYDGDPRRLFLAAVALLIFQQNVVIDLAGKSNLLRYAGNATIEDIGWLYGSRGDRLPPSKSMTTIEFTLSALRPGITTVDTGTRVAVGNLTFATVAPLNIPAGELKGAVLAERDEPGPEGNGIEAGQVFQFIDRVPFIESAVSLTESTGGSDLESLEAYRYRLREVPESFSTAGPDGAYWFWAKSANPGIVDVDVFMPPLDNELFKTYLGEIKTAGLAVIDDAAALKWYERFMELCRETGTGPGNVNVVPLMENGELPTQDILDAVYDACNDRTRRPLTDFLHVLPPAAVEYDLDMTYYIDADRAALSVEIQAAVADAVEQYIVWQHSELGRSIIPDVLTRLCMAAGARRLEITSPVYTKLSRGEVAQLKTTDVKFGGLERRS